MRIVFRALFVVTLLAVGLGATPALAACEVCEQDGYTCYYIVVNG